MEDYKKILTNLKEWVEEAGLEQMNKLKGPMKIDRKSADIDLVTEVDVWTEKFLLEKIQTNYPTHAILTEESGIHEGEAEFEWVIDPIDGTTNFAHKFPLFCISVGIRHRDETVIGLVYLPMLNEWYEAVKGQGAFLNGERIQVSSVEKLTEAVVATGFPYDRAKDPQNNVENFSSVVTKVGGIRRTGSAAIDLCQVAAGRFDGYWELKLKQWDLEAGILIVKEAGGITKVIERDKGFSVLVGNQAVYDLLSESISL